MSLMRWSSPMELNRIEREMEDIVEPIPYSFLSSISIPRVYVYGVEKDIIVKAEIPGNKRQDIDVFIQDNIIRLSGKTFGNKNSITKPFSQEEKSLERFSKTIPLPWEVRGDQAIIEYRDGILSIVVPKYSKKNKRVGN